MRNLILVLVVLLTFTHLIYAKFNFGIHTNAVFPKGDYSKYHKSGYEVGIIGKFNHQHSKFTTVGGLSYTTLPGKIIKTKFFNDEVKIHWQEFKLLKTSCGIQFGNESGIYILPLITASFRVGEHESGYTAIGTEIGTGYILPFRKIIKHMDIGIKYNRVNLFKEKEEAGFNLLKIGITLIL